MMMTSTTSHIRGQFEGTVLSNELICDEHYRMMLEAPGFPEIRPGQFAQLACREWDESRYEQHEMEWGEKLTGDEMTGQRAFLRRPFSFSGQEGSCIELIYRTVGVGTRWLSDLQPGKTLGVIGPLGNGFLFPPPGAGAILVGGGVGIPPMIHLASKLGSRAVAICGATREGLMPLSLFGDVNISGEPSLCAREFGRSGTPAILCTDDGSLGFKGFVTVAMERHLTLNPPKPGTTVYTCGPEVMMKRVAEIAKAFGLPCQVSVERSMACGMGTCQSCVIKVKKADPSRPPEAGKESCYRLACTDGPVFEGKDIEW